MSIVELLLLLVVAGLCGSVAKSLAGHSRRGCLASIVLGFIGALLGSWLSRQFELPEILAIPIGDRSFPIVWSVIGASLFVAVLGFLSGGRSRGRY